MLRFFQLTVIGALALIVSGCDTVNKYASRTTVQNERAGQSLNEETLLNILRSKDFKPINFIATTQMSTYVTQGIDLGLPTITFGPRQEASSKQFVFGNNSVHAATGLQYQSSPLITAEFIKGQNLPLPISNLAILLANLPREVVYYTAIDRVRIVFSEYSLNLTNDPSNNIPPEGDACINHQDDAVESSFYSRKYEPYCNFSKFQHIVDSLVKHGVTAELIAITDKDSKDDSESNKRTSPKMVGQFCYDQSLDFSTRNKSSSLRSCGSGKIFSDSASLSISRSRHKTEILFRSPAKIYRYVGELVANNDPLIIKYKDRDASQFQGEKFINIIKDDGSECEVALPYGNERWCVPSIGSRSTFAVFSILQNLRNLSISPDDTNKGLLLTSTN